MKLKDLIKVLDYYVEVGILPEGEYKWPIMTERADKIDEKYLDLKVLYVDIRSSDWILVQLKGLKKAS